jgi:hypothetical protein
MASATSCGSLSFVKTAELLSPVSAFAAIFIAILLTEQDTNNKQQITNNKKNFIFNLASYLS